jgi:hypothetical protein
MIKAFTSSRFTLFQSGTYFLSAVVIAPRIYRCTVENIDASTFTGTCLEANMDVIEKLKDAQAFLERVWSGQTTQEERNRTGQVITSGGAFLLCITVASILARQIDLGLYFNNPWIRITSMAVLLISNWLGADWLMRKSLLSGWRDILRAGAISGLWLVVYGAGTFEPIAVFAQFPLLHLGLVIVAGLGIFFAAIRYESSYLAAFANLACLGGVALAPMGSASLVGISILGIVGMFVSRRFSSRGVPLVNAAALWGMYGYLFLQPSVASDNIVSAVTFLITAFSIALAVDFNFGDSEKLAPVVANLSALTVAISGCSYFFFASSPVENALTWLACAVLLGLRGFMYTAQRGSIRRYCYWLLSGGALSTGIGLYLQSLEAPMLTSILLAVGWSMLLGQTHEKSFVRRVSAVHLASTLALALPSIFLGTPSVVRLFALLVIACLAQVADFYLTRPAEENSHPMELWTIRLLSTLLASLGVLESCFLQSGMFASTMVTVTAAVMRLRYALRQENYWNRISLLLATVAFGQLTTVQLWNLNSYEQVVNATLTGIALMAYGASYYLPMVRQSSDQRV